MKSDSKPDLSSWVNVDLDQQYHQHRSKWTHWIHRAHTCYISPEVLWGPEMLCMAFLTFRRLSKAFLIFGFKSQKVFIQSQMWSKAPPDVSPTNIQSTSRCASEHYSGLHIWQQLLLLWQFLRLHLMGFFEPVSPQPAGSGEAHMVFPIPTWQLWALNTGNGHSL